MTRTGNPSSFAKRSAQGEVHSAKKMRPVSVFKRYIFSRKAASDNTNRSVPETSKNNFRHTGMCVECVFYNRPYGRDIYRCREKTFRGDVHVFTAFRRTCDRFKPKEGFAS